jgi:3-deoxy-7-phosphoheptulonate synthase
MKKRSFGPTPNYPLVEKYEHPNNHWPVISGSCSVESRDQVFEIAKIVKDCGATHLRGGVFRAGTYPSDKIPFGWVSPFLIQSFHEAALKNGLQNIIEVLDYSDESFELIKDYCHAFQIGARSMQNYSLLSKVGKYGKPVFLKRNTGSTVDEWLGAAEYLLRNGVKELYLIERGSSTFHNDVRWTPCIHTIPSVRSVSKIPVIVDASHGTGRSDLVGPMTLAGVAAGAGGVLIECHTQPEKSISDAEQAIGPNELAIILSRVKLIKGAIY